MTDHVLWHPMAPDGTTGEPQDGITRDITDGLLIDALTAGMTHQAAAEHANLSKRTVERRLQDDGFCRRLRDAVTERERATATRLVHAVSESLTVLLGIVQDEDEPTRERISAARTILEAQRTRPLTVGTVETAAESVDMVREKAAHALMEAAERLTV